MTYKGVFNRFKRDPESSLMTFSQLVIEDITPNNIENVKNMLIYLRNLEPKLNIDDKEIEDIVNRLKLEIYEGIKEDDFFNILERLIIEKVSVEKEDFEFLAARVALYKLYMQIARKRGIEFKGFDSIYNPEKFVENIYRGVEKGFYGEYLIKEYSREELLEMAKEIDWRRDLLFRYMGIKTLEDRYLVKDDDGKPFELIQEMYALIALTLALPEKKEKRLEWAKKFYWVLSTHRSTAATPTLMNARRPFPQLSSCFVLTVDDFLFDIFDNLQKVAEISKFAGGVGIYLGKIRAKGSQIQQYKNVAQGVIPVVRLLNDIAVYVDQLGIRKGAISPTLDIWHMDILDFLEIKTTHGDERLKAHDVFPAVSIPDIFMKRLKRFLETGEPQRWTLFDPFTVRIYLAKKLFNELKQKYDFKEKRISNLSFEFMLEFESEEKAKEFEENEKDKFLATLREGNKVFVKVKGLEDYWGEEFEKLYEELEKLDSKEILKKEVDLFELWRKLVGAIFEQGMPFIFFRDTANRLNPNKHKGIVYSSNLCMEIVEPMSPTLHLEYKEENGKIIHVKQAGHFPTCNLASINLGIVNTKEEIEKVLPIVVRMLDNVLDVQYSAVLESRVYNRNFRSIGIGVNNYHYMLAKKFINWESERHLKYADKIFELIAFYAVKASVELAKEKGKYPYFDGSDWSKGILFGKTKEQLMEETKRTGNNLPWDELVEEVKKYGMRNGNLLALMPTSATSVILGGTASIDPVFDLVYKEEKMNGIIPRVMPEASKLGYFYKSAYLIDQTWSIRAAAVRQKWVDQSQSFNLYVDPNKIDGPTLTRYYLLAWELGLKAVYYLRSKSMTDIEECESCQA